MTVVELFDSVEREEYMRLISELFDPNGGVIIDPRDFATTMEARPCSSDYERDGFEALPVGNSEWGWCYIASDKSRIIWLPADGGQILFIGSEDSTIRDHVNLSLCRAPRSGSVSVSLQLSLKNAYRVLRPVYGESGKEATNRYENNDRFFEAINGYACDYFPK